jgi:transposase-like protein
MSEAPPPAHAVPFYCPYCAEQDLVPAEAESSWRCESCTREFTLTFRGLTPR